VAEVKSYRVTYELDESGHWIATVPVVKGCHTYGRSIHEARERIREALGLFVRDAARARLVDVVRLPAGVLSLLAQQRQARSRAERQQQRASLVLARAVKRLRGDLGLSVRDAGELLNLSHQRVQQLTPRDTAGTRRA
jgi:predicted RNase H-like HicB family nuclease